jgi:hypothetical protein
MTMDRAFAAARRTLAAVSLLTCVAALSAACASTSATPTPTATSPGAGAGTAASASAIASASSGSSAASSAATAGSNTGGGSGGGGSTSTAAAASTTCSVRYLNGDIGLSQGTAGSVYVNLTFKNLNNAPCTLYGYPGVSFGNGTPVDQVGQPASRDHAVTPAVVTLAPGAFAYATLKVTDALNFPASTCKPVKTSWLLVYPPNTSNLLYVPYNTTACSGNVVTLSVQAVQPGNGG